MKTNTENLISITDANQNFSKVCREVDNLGNVIILKNNKPKYYICDINEVLQLTDEEKILIVAKRILNQHSRAFKELAKWLDLIKIKFCYYSN